MNCACRGLYTKIDEPMAVLFTCHGCGRQVACMPSEVANMPVYNMQTCRIESGPPIHTIQADWAPLRYVKVNREYRVVSQPQMELSL